MTLYMSHKQRLYNNLTSSLRSAFAPALSSDCVVATSPASAAKKSAVQPVLCGDGRRQGEYHNEKTGPVRDSDDRAIINIKSTRVQTV